MNTLCNAVSMDIMQQIQMITWYQQVNLLYNDISVTNSIYQGILRFIKWMHDMDMSCYFVAFSRLSCSGSYYENIVWKRQVSLRYCHVYLKDILQWFNNMNIQYETSCYFEALPWYEHNMLVWGIAVFIQIWRIPCSGLIIWRYNMKRHVIWRHCHDMNTMSVWRIAVFT